MQTYNITIQGTVQGVGFRPFVYQLADRFGLNGTVLNSANGVEITLNSEAGQLEEFVDALRNELPPLAAISSIEIAEIPSQSFDSFQIIQSDDSDDVTVRIPPDVSICPECERELFDPANRRYGYPFITCTNCGVRYSIIDDLPYDRANTSMKFFKMCDKCRAEYTNPLDRRYHAQPIGCWECGPSLSLWDKSEELRVKSEELVEAASQLLSEGHILAVKGVGGYHLMCDAANDEAVMRLRERKHRPAKPFAVMVRDIDMARQLAVISEEEEALLTSKERPIVLLDRVEDLGLRGRVADGVAPGLSHIGLFLPYAPLHLLLLEKLDRPLVATSANITDEPLATDRESIERLEGVYDYLLDHDRDIINGVDDSVVMVAGGRQIILRRARGYAPSAVTLPFVLEKKRLSVGANQKSTVAIGFDDQAILSPHIGDLDSIASVEYFERNIATLKRIYHFEPDEIIHDLHPSYESTKVALRQAQEIGTELAKVQHHYAHILGVMAEKQIKTSVFGVAFDGTGYGDDGHLWGGEFMVCDYEGYERVGHLRYFKLLGGERAIREPRRVALSLLFDLCGESAKEMDNPTIHAFTPAELDTQYTMWSKSLNAPLSSSVGRLFDAVSSLIGVCQTMSYEGESGMRMEELYDESVEGHYGFEYKNREIDILPIIEQILMEEDITVAVSKFFHTLIEMIAVIYNEYKDLPLVCSGGVFQNRVLISLLVKRFPNVYLPTLYPPNDGGIALGQIVAQ